MSLLFGGIDYEHPEDIVTGAALPSEPSGVYIVSDSAITSVDGSKTILGEFKKIYPVDIRVRRPEFDPGGYFRGYGRVYEERPAIIGFAGSTLTAQHILTEVRASLRSLMISCLPRNGPGHIHYCICSPGEPNELHQPNRVWEDDAFTDADFPGLLTSDVIAEVVLRSMDRALQSARKYKLTAEDFVGLRTELLLGTWCTSGGHRLFKLEMQEVEVDGYLMATVKLTEIPRNQIGAIGLPGFDQGADAELCNSLEQRRSVFSGIHAHLGRCVDKARADGKSVVDRPIYGILLKEHKISYV